ncbi:HAD family hydrolase [Streptomyces sp. NPDC098085]|uniref:HAD family hydrolase n=1 Tax=Streptomyces sp. NPDC098085 TaxID=3366094 RepID=UPI00381955FC
MSTDRRIVLFDLFGVIARHQRPGALAEMAARCNAPADAFAEAYWACRRPYDAGQWSASEYWAAVLRWLSHTADADTVEELRLAAIDSWSRVDGRMVAYVRSLRDVAEVALLSNLPSDHADAFRAAQPWLRDLDHVAFSGKINAAKPDPAAFCHCVVAMRAAPADFLFVDDRDENVLQNSVPVGRVGNSVRPTRSGQDDPVGAELGQRLTGGEATVPRSDAVDVHIRRLHPGGGLHSHLQPQLLHGLPRQQ